VTERRTRWILVLLLVAQLVLITAQVSTSQPEPTVLERGLLRLVAPVARGVREASRLPNRLLERFRGRRSLLEENRRLRHEVRDLRLEMLRLSDVEEEMKRLRGALDYAQGRDGARLRVADVVYADHTSSMRTLIVYVGDATGVVKNQPVVAADGLVGRVIFTTGPYAKVQLLTDRAAAVGAMIERTRRQGIIRGWTSPELRPELRLQLVPLQAEVYPGDRVLTSGIDGVYPRGIPVGTVVSVEPSEGLFHRIRVRPATDFGKLDQVYLLSTDPVPEKLRTELPPELRGEPQSPEASSPEESSGASP
jgi:rod shape-determining protein MreC